MAKVNELVSSKEFEGGEFDIIKTLHSRYAPEMNQINDIILTYIDSDEKIITEAARHLISSGGKRIRPLLTILSANLMNIEHNNKHHITLAAATEFIHTATLLHDDVVDSSLLRRFHPTVNAIWGNQEAILVGDFLFSASFKLMVSARSYEALEILAESSRIIAKGEVSQLAFKKSKKFIDEVSYFSIISSKTAELFGAACKVGAIIANATSENQRLVGMFGIYLGLIYQIKDDIMDYYSDTQYIGKNIGDDFYESKITLPIIYLREVADLEDQNYIENLFLNLEAKSPEDLGHVIFLLKKYHIILRLQEKMDELHQICISYLDQILITQPEAERYLRELVNFASARVL